MDTKRIKLDQEIFCLTKENNQYKRTLTNIRNTILKLNDNFSQNKGKSCQLLNENEWIQCSYFAELKENEKQCLEYIDNLNSLKNELNEIKNVYIEKWRESKSWDNKVKLLSEMKKKGDFSDIDAMKNEIHRMQIRESQLKRILEKIMLDLEVCILRREMIYNKVSAKDVRLKGKNETKQKLLKKLDNLRMNIKKIKIDCKKLDQNTSDLQNNKTELESKCVHLKDRQIYIQKNIDSLIRSIEDIGATKINNIHNLMYKQTQTKFLDEVKKGKYRLLIKNESKMNEEFAIEWKKNSDLICVLEALKNDFPDLNFQITRLLNILKLIDS